ncbi:MAG: hypothetical protein JJLCMIEE_01242 [Acidimicrobiales bacterium]|nr:hypothetical protein [Acidimicrobiales bacterium]
MTVKGQREYGCGGASRSSGYPRTGSAKRGVTCGDAKAAGRRRQPQQRVGSTRSAKRGVACGNAKPALRRRQPQQREARTGSAKRDVTCGDAKPAGPSRHCGGASRSSGYPRTGWRSQASPAVTPSQQGQASAAEAPAAAAGTPERDGEARATCGGAKPTGPSQRCGGASRSSGYPRTRWRSPRHLRWRQASRERDGEARATCGGAKPAEHPIREAGRCLWQRQTSRAKPALRRRQPQQRVPQNAMAKPAPPAVAPSQ